MTTAKSPNERFKKWVGTVGGQGSAGKLLGISQSYVCLLSRGRCRPALALARSIEDATKGTRGGVVRAVDWIDQPLKTEPVRTYQYADRKSAERAS